ncbi:MAG: DUF2199 domain-containing protein [bacterium]
MLELDPCGSQLDIGLTRASPRSLRFHETLPVEGFTAGENAGDRAVVRGRGCAQVSLSERNFVRAQQLWTVPGREAEPTYFGWLQTALPYEPSTLSLETQVHTRPVGERPFIELRATDHPLSIEQRRGISLARVQSIVERALHG